MANKMLVPAKVAGFTVATVKIKNIWAKFTLPPNAQANDATIVGDGRHLYAMGGWPDEFPVPDVSRWDPGSNTWSEFAPLPLERWAGISAFLNGRIYLIGGQNYDDSTDTVFMYDLADPAAGWQTLHALPFITSQGTAAAANGKLYTPGPGTTTDIWAYDPANDAAGWNLVGALPVATAEGVLAGSGNRLFYLGGTDWFGPWFQTAYSYNAGTNTWSAITSLPAGTFSMGAGFAADGRLWVAIRDQFLVYSYDPANNAAGWRAEPAPPVKTYDGWLNQVGPWMTFVNGSFGHAYRVTTVPLDLLYPTEVIGSTGASVTITIGAPTAPPADKYLVPATVVGQTAVVIRGATYLRPDLVYSQNTTRIEMSLRGVFTPDVVAGSTAVHIAGDINLIPDPVRGKTDVDIPVYAHGDRWLIPDTELGATYVRIVSRPVLRTNTPILLAFSARTRIETMEPDRVGGQKIRSVAGLVLNMPEPAISDGRPSLPDYWAGHRADGSASGIGASANLIQGPLHIHAIPDPNPKWDPRTGGWSHPPPPSGGGDLRWTVDTLPDPNAQEGGWYWLGQSVGDPSTHAHVNAQWHTSPGSIADVYFDSFYPFRPSVNSYNGYIPGERTVTHAKGVHFNSHYIEHMWADFGQNQNQPFTWIVVATIMSDPFPGYQHTILDAGRNPDSIGFPHIGANATSTERLFGDNLPYRTRLAWGGDTATMQTSGDSPIRAKAGGGYHPRMFLSVFDGEKSQVGMWDPFGKAMGVGTVGSGPTYSHRYLTLGREQGWLSQRHAANILVFEMRYWMHALSRSDLESQYAQLSSTHQFDAYRHL